VEKPKKGENTITSRVGGVQDKKREGKRVEPGPKKKGKVNDNRFLGSRIGEISPGGKGKAYLFPKKDALEHCPKGKRSGCCLTIFRGRRRERDRPLGTGEGVRVSPFLRGKKRGYFNINVGKGESKDLELGKKKKNAKILGEGEGEKNARGAMGKKKGGDQSPETSKNSI